MPKLSDQFEQKAIDLGQAIADGWQRLQNAGDQAEKEIDELKDDFAALKGALERIWSAALADPNVPAQEVIDEGSNSGASDVSHPPVQNVNGTSEPYGADETPDVLAQRQREQERQPDEVNRETTVDKDQEDEDADRDDVDSNEVPGSDGTPRDGQGKQPLI